MLINKCWNISTWIYKATLSLQHQEAHVYVLKEVNTCYFAVFVTHKTPYSQTLVKKSNREKTGEQQTAEILTIQNMHTPQAIVFLFSSLSTEGEIYRGQIKTLALRRREWGREKRGEGRTQDKRKTNWWHSVKKAGNTPEADELYKSAGCSKAFQSQVVFVLLCFFTLNLALCCRSAIGGELFDVGKLQVGKETRSVPKGSN